MSTFEQHLLDIDDAIGPEVEERNTHLKLKQKVTEWLIEEMRRADTVFDKLCVGLSPYAGNNDWNGDFKSNEFEVICVLEFPYAMQIGLDNDRRGFVHLDMYDVLNKLANDSKSDDVFILLSNLVSLETAYLQRQALQNWISQVINKALDSMHNYPYKVAYNRCEYAHILSVFERTTTVRMIAIDFRPVIAFGKVNWMKTYAKTIKNKYYYSWYALPIESSLPADNHTHEYTFLMINPMAENELLWSNESLKVVFRLLCSLRDNYGLHELRDYMITNTLFWLVKKSSGLLNGPTRDIFIDALLRLNKFFDDANMPSFWVVECNLLDVFTKVDIQLYKKKFQRIYTQFVSYRKTKQLPLDRVLEHFFVK